MRIRITAKWNEIAMGAGWPERYERAVPTGATFDAARAFEGAVVVTGLDGMHYHLEADQYEAIEQQPLPEPPTEQESE